MKRLCFIALSFFLVLSSCGKPASASPETIYRRLYSSELSTFDYVAASSAADLSVLSNLVDSLVDCDTFGRPVPALAESWESNADYTKWTFKIRKGVSWLTSKGVKRGEVTANDFVAAARHSNEARVSSANQYMYEFVKNAFLYYSQSLERFSAQNALEDGNVKSIDEYYQKHNIDSSKFISFDEVGVKAIDDYTLTYEMESPCPFFLSCVTYASYLPIYGPFLEEMGDRFGTGNDEILYCGPYIFSEYLPSERQTLTKNDDYWDTENVHIEKIERIYNSDEPTIAPYMARMGETDYAQINSDILDAWMKQENLKALIHPARRDISFSYFYAFNFEPRFDERYEPDNWKIAVNSENFRKSIMYGLDRIKALSVQDPYSAADIANNTITPARFSAAKGKDYTNMGDLAQISVRDSFNPEEALKAKEAAIVELKAQGCKFPVKILMPYNPSVANWDKECQVIEQQLEGLLGKGYIDIVLEAGPAAGFLGEVRRSGKYAFMKCNCGADYSDPQTWSMPFMKGSTYTFMHQDRNTTVSGKVATSKKIQTQALVEEYDAYIYAAKAQGLSIAERYQAFAKAEAFLINHAFAIPFSVSYSGYVVDRLNIFTQSYAPYGVSSFHFKGARLLGEPMSSQTYEAAYSRWKAEWAAAQSQ